MNLIYSKKGFNIYKCDNYLIVHNTKKEFADGHTHLTSLKQAKYLIDMSIYKRMPHHLSKYLLESLIRLSNDEEYSRKISELHGNKTKKDTYYNSRKK